ncbi:hypothetical protein F444_15079, partial [Phytophthora nicotianae P1976]
MCFLIVTVSSRSKYQAFTISTSKTDCGLIYNFIGPVIYQAFPRVQQAGFRATCNRFTGYKKESMIQQVDAKSSTIFLKNAKIEISGPRNLTFIVTTPELSQAGKKFILTATSTREFNKWITALQVTALPSLRQITRRSTAA